MRILHIASFNGNIGDNISHNGFRKKISELFTTNIQYTNLEMREFYKSWNKKRFDSDEFVSLCNKHDLVVFGGGNYLEAKWKYSHTGTNFDITLERMDKMKTPILFNSIGVDVINSGDDETKEKFYRFLKYIQDENRFFLGLRNDGSYEIIENFLGKNEMKNIHYTYDSAYFSRRYFSQNKALANRKYIGINIGKDMKDVRWNEESISYKEFVQNMCKSITEILNIYLDYDIIFIPHIYSDLEAIYDIIEQLDDIVRRIRIMVAPLVTGQGNEKFILNIYSQCELVWGMRFHSNISAIIHNTPTIALYCHERILNLYKSMELESRIVNVRKTFNEELIEKTIETINCKEKIVEQYRALNDAIEKHGKQYFLDVYNWFQCK